MIDSDNIEVVPRAERIDDAPGFARGPTPWTPFHSVGEYRHGTLAVRCTRRSTIRGVREDSDVGRRASEIPCRCNDVRLLKGRFTCERSTRTRTLDPLNEGRRVLVNVQQRSLALLVETVMPERPKSVPVRPAQILPARYGLRLQQLWPVIGCGVDSSPTSATL